MKTFVDIYLEDISQKRFSRNHLKYNSKYDRKEGSEFIYWLIDPRREDKPYIECTFNKMNGVYSTVINPQGEKYDRIMRNYGVISRNCFLERIQVDGDNDIINVSTLEPKFICMAAFGITLEGIEKYLMT